jgi:hypothetical protein
MTRAKSLPVPSGSTPIWHCFCTTPSNIEKKKKKNHSCFVSVCPVITLCNQTRSRKEPQGGAARGKKSSESTHIHMELVDFGKDPTNRSVAAANQDPEWIKVPE